MVDIEREQTRQAQTLKEIEARQKAIEMGVRDFPVMAWCNLNNVKATVQSAAAIGKRAAVLSREMGHPIGKIRDQRFGSVNTYTEEVLSEVFTEIGSTL